MNETRVRRSKGRIQKARDRLCCAPLITCGRAERRPKTICGREWKEELVFALLFFLFRDSFLHYCSNFVSLILFVLSLCCRFWSNLVLGVTLEEY